MSTPDGPTTPIFDGHNDTLLRIALLPNDDDWSFFEHNTSGTLDLPRAKAGQMAGGIFAIFPPPEGDPPTKEDIERTDAGYAFPPVPALSFETARAFTLEAMAILDRLEEESRGEFFVAHSIEQLKSGIDEGRMGAVLHFEGAEAIDEQLELLPTYYEAGLRSLGIVWSRPNAFGQGVPFRYPSSPDVGPGLSDAGVNLVAACNELGILIDMAHLNEAGFWDVARLSDSPLVVSHACCHAICPSARNITDKQIDVIGESNGIVGINFYVGDIREDGDFRKDASLDQLIAHIDHVVERIGIDHVGFGSDFDGARMPSAIGDASGLPHLIDALSHKGYDDDAIRKIACDNWLRVFEQSW